MKLDLSGTVLEKKRDGKKAKFSLEDLKVSFYRTFFCGGACSKSCSTLSSSEKRLTLLSYIVEDNCLGAYSKCEATL